MTRRTPLLLAVLPLLLGALVVPSTAHAVVDNDRRATARPKVGTYEGTFGPKGQKSAFSLDVVKRKGRLSVSRAVVFYRCGDSTEGEEGYTSYTRVKVRKGRFAKSSIVDIAGRFTSRTKVKGSARPAPGLFGCKGKAKPFSATWVGPTVSRGGTFAGTDATGAPVSFVLEAGGKVLDDLDVTRKIVCGTHSYSTLSSFGRSLVHHDGAASSTFLDDFYPATFTYSVALDAAGGASGSYRVSGPDCDTGDVPFTAAKAG